MPSVFLHRGACSQTRLLLFATGMDKVTASDVQVTIGEVSSPVKFAGPQGTFIWLDQINVVVPRALAGSGTVPIVLTAGGQTTNTVNVTFQ